MDRLRFIKDQLESIGVPYEFGEWTTEIKYPYFVGEISEEEPTTEDGAEFSTFMLNGFHRGKYIDLEEIREKIKKHFSTIHGLRGSTESGAIAVFYGSAFYIPTNEADLKRIQINLTIKEWKGVL